MEQLDLFYRAFTEYKKHTHIDVECTRFNTASKTQNKIENEDLIITFSTCTIKEDWIIAIENGLTFVEKAIKEERQFIRHDSDVLPIEKIRKTSKKSIQDLAKHSNYITHLPQEGSPSSVVPDQLLVIRKENDYAVYENKVLYALLISLKDFIASRLNTIKEATNKYEAKSLLKKEISIGNQKLAVSFDLHEIRKNDPIAIKKNTSQNLIDRIDTVYSSVLSLLDTQLMNELSKVELVKRPITKTNVLKMDRNFKESLALFDFVADYDEPGYTIKKVIKSLSPLAFECVADYTEIIMLISFITYQYSNSLSDELKKNYFEEEIRRQAEAEDKILEKLRNIHAKINLSGKTIDEYLLLFEEGYRILENRLAGLKTEIKQMIIAHKKEIEAMISEHNREIKLLNARHEQEVIQLKAFYEQEMTELKTSYDAIIDALKKNHAAEIYQLCEEHKNTIDELNGRYEKTVSNLRDEHKAEVDSLKSKNEEEVSALHEDFAHEMNELEKRITALNEKMLETKKNADEKVDIAENMANDCAKQANADICQAIYERDLAKGELSALRQELDKPPLPEDFISRERFEELERERAAFERFFAETWSVTKKTIRKSLLGKQTEKKKSKNKKKE